MITKSMSKKRKAYIFTMKTLMAISTVLTCSLVLFLIVYIFKNGLPNISWKLISTSPSYLTITSEYCPT